MSIVKDIVIGCIFMLAIPAALGYGLMMFDATKPPPRLPADDTPPPPLTIWKWIGIALIAVLLCAGVYYGWVWA